MSREIWRLNNWIGWLPANPKMTYFTFPKTTWQSYQTFVIRSQFGWNHFESSLSTFLKIWLIQKVFVSIKIVSPVLSLLLKRPVTCNRSCWRPPTTHSESSNWSSHPSLKTAAAFCNSWHQSYRDWSDVWPTHSLEALLIQHKCNTALSCPDSRITHESWLCGNGVHPLAACPRRTGFQRRHFSSLPSAQQTVLQSTSVPPLGNAW